MGLLDWFILVMTETAKYFLFTYGILGFQVREGKKKYLYFCISWQGVFGPVISTVRVYCSKRHGEQ